MDFKCSETNLQKELKTQYIDWQWLNQFSLNSQEMAMEYFYTSPFYHEQRTGTLNELLRAGEMIGKVQDGLLFEVTYDNLNEIKNEAPSQLYHKHIYFNQNSIFHIKLHSRKTGLQGMIYTPLKVYCILDGRIYRLSTLSDVLRNKMANTCALLENCFDMIIDSSQWNLMKGYSWCASGNIEEKEKLLKVCQDFAMINEESLLDKYEHKTHIYRRKLKINQPSISLSNNEIIKQQDFDISDVSYNSSQSLNSFEPSNLSTYQTLENIKPKFVKENSEIALQICRFQLKQLINKRKDLASEKLKSTTTSQTNI